MIRRPPRSPLFPYPPLSRSPALGRGGMAARAAGAARACAAASHDGAAAEQLRADVVGGALDPPRPPERAAPAARRSEEHTSGLQAPCNLACRLLPEKKKISH